MNAKIDNTSFKIREAPINDVSALAALHVETFYETHGMYPHAPTFALREYQWQKAFQDKDDSWFCFVFEKDDEGLIGFAKGQPYNQAEHIEFSGELNKIYFLHKYHKLGLGRQLVCKVANEFIQRGINSMLLFGDANSPSNKFYERLGAVKLFTKNGEFHGGYGWKDLKRFVADNCTEA
jgi:RimJ/RimL family protein N-acetyltransferase